MNIRNQGNKPIFVVCNRKGTEGYLMQLKGQAIWIPTGTRYKAQGTNNIGNLVCNWHQSDKPSLSDHRYICFQKDNIAITRATFRDPKKPNWKSYIDYLRENLETKFRSICMTRDKIWLLTSCNRAPSCPIRITVQPGPLTHSLTHQGKYPDGINS
jgi:hypothetical protein